MTSGQSGEQSASPAGLPVEVFAVPPIPGKPAKPDIKTPERPVHPPLVYMRICWDSEIAPQRSQEVLWNQRAEFTESPIIGS